MKRLIRSRSSQEYLTAAGKWTRDHRLAEMYQSDYAARKARNEFRLQNCELYYLVGEAPSPSDFALALERL